MVFTFNRRAGGNWGEENWGQPPIFMRLHEKIAEKNRWLSPIFLFVPVVICILVSIGPSWAAETGVQEAFRQSLSMEAVGRHEQAIEPMLSLWGQYPEDPSIALRLGWLYRKAGKPAEAGRWYKKAEKLSDGGYEGRLGWLEDCMDLGRWRKVEHLAGMLLEENPGNANIRLARALSLYEQGRYGDAERAYRQVIEFGNRGVDAYSGLGWSLLMQSKRKQAEEAFGSALAMDSQAPSPKAGMKTLRAGLRWDANGTFLWQVFDENPYKSYGLGFSTRLDMIFREQFHVWGAFRYLHYEVPSDSVSSLFASDFYQIEGYLSAGMRMGWGRFSLVYGYLDCHSEPDLWDAHVVGFTVEKPWGPVLLGVRYDQGTSFSGCGGHGAIFR